MFELYLFFRLYFLYINYFSYLIDVLSIQEDCFIFIFVNMNLSNEYLSLFADVENGYRIHYNLCIQNMNRS